MAMLHLQNDQQRLETNACIVPLDCPNACSPVTIISSFSVPSTYLTNLFSGPNQMKKDLDVNAEAEEDQPYHR